MNKGFWNTFVAFGLAAGMVASARPALSASKKTQTPSADASTASTSSSGKSAKVEKVNLNTADEKTSPPPRASAQSSRRSSSRPPLQDVDDVSR